MSWMDLMVVDTDMDELHSLRMDGFVIIGIQGSEGKNLTFT
jgi:hypothetical protein